MYKFIVLFIFTLCAVCNSTNILAIIPSPLPSHQIPLRQLWKELCAKGHNLTLVTPNPIKTTNIKNIIEIGIYFSLRSFL